MAFLAPRWADAPSAETGLDLDWTRPSVGSIVDDFEPVYPDNPILYVAEVHEHLVPKPLAALRQVRAVRTQLYDIAGPTGPHGILLGTQRWQV